jgi:hypothetical protein
LRNFRAGYRPGPGHAPGSPVWPAIPGENRLPGSQRAQMEMLSRTAPARAAARCTAMTAILRLSIWRLPSRCNASLPVGALSTATRLQAGGRRTAPADCPPSRGRSSVRRGASGPGRSPRSTGDRVALTGSLVCATTPGGNGPSRGRSACYPPSEHEGWRVVVSCGLVEPSYRAPTWFLVAGVVFGRRREGRAVAGLL